jgi:hypothetical protein
LKTRGEFRCSGRVGNSCSTSDTCHVNRVTNPDISHERGKDWEVLTTSGTYSWSFMTQIFHNGQPSRGGNLTKRNPWFSSFLVGSNSLSRNHKLWNIVSTKRNIYSICRCCCSPRFLCRSMAFFSTCWSRGTSESSTYGKKWICRCNSVSTHFHISWLSDFIFYPKP